MMMLPCSSATLIVALSFLLASSTTTTTAFVIPRTTTAPPSLSQMALQAEKQKKRVVVIGNGMVGQRFMENLLKLDDQDSKACEIATFCEEPRAAYNRVKLTSYFETRDPSSLSMTSEFDADGRTAWYDENGVRLLLGDKAVRLDTSRKIIQGQSGTEIPYDVAVLATGSFPFVPPIPGRQRVRASCFCFVRGCSLA